MGFTLTHWKPVSVLLMLAVFATMAFYGGVAADPGHEKDSKSKGDPHDPAKPRISVSSEVITAGECLATHQKELEGPVAGTEEIWGPLFDENGDPVIDEETGEHVHGPTGEFFDVLREIEIIRAISTCAQTDRDHDDFAFTTSQLETIMSMCTKQADLSGGWCDTQRFEEHRDDDDDDDQPEPPDNGDGQVLFALQRVDSIYGVSFVGPWRPSAHVQTGGIEENLFAMGGDGDPMTLQLADSWSVNAFGTMVTITLKQGIPWYAPAGQEQLDGEFGDLVAQDVVDWLNTANRTTNPDSTYPDAGDFAAVFLGAEAINETTLEIGLVSPLFYGLPLSQFGILGAARGPYFARGIDIMGLDWAQNNAVGTGPFRQGECIQGDRCTAEALEDHWRETATIDSITVLQVPDEDTRVALLRNGQIDMAQMDFRRIPGLVDEGFQFIDTQPGNFIGQSVMYPGNLWEETHARTGEALNPWDSPAYDEDFAWIGDPWQESHPANVRYVDTNNPTGMSDMEQARLVRLALGTAIDRHEINGVALDGGGRVLYSEYMGPEYPGWDPGRDTGCWTHFGDRIDCGGSEQSVDWALSDGNLAEADSLLTVAGFPPETRFESFGAELMLEVYHAEAGAVGFEVGDLIASYWEELGIPVSQLFENYGGVISPRLRQRIQAQPVLKNADVHSNVFPVDWPYPPADTSITRPGWGAGFESPYLASQHFSIRGSEDEGFREEEHLNTADYMLYWQLYNGVYQVPRGVIANDRIAEWGNPLTHFGSLTGAHAPEFLRLN